MDPLMGKTLGQYQIVGLAGAGGMATVYRAYQPSLNRYVALKVLPEHMAQDEQFVARFRQEALAAAALRHPNILVIYDVGREGNWHYIAAEFLAGATLSQVITQQRGPLPLSRIVNITQQLASALDFAHQRGLVHRDIKPSNIFIGPSDHVTLMDFGIVKALASTAQLTRRGAMIGTPEYMSPEQAEGRPLDHRSDIYSLGVVVYQLLTGQVPFTARTPSATLLAHVSQPPVPPSQLNPMISPEVEAVVLCAMAKRPEERFATVGQMAQALAQAAAGPPAAASLPPTVAMGRPSPTPPAYAPQPAAAPLPTGRAPGTLAPKARKGGSGRWLAAALAGLLLVLVAGALAGIWFFFLQPPSVGKLLEQAGQSAAAGRYDEAIAAYGRVLEKEPDNVEALRGLGLIYYELARYDQAIGPLQNVVGQRPDDWAAQRALGLSLYRLGQPESALEHLNQVIALGAGVPGDKLADVYYALSGYYFGKQDDEQAIRLGRRAQELDPAGQSPWAGETRTMLEAAYTRLAQNALSNARLDLDFSNILIEPAGTYAIARTGQKINIAGAAHLVDGPRLGSRALVMEEATVNLISNPSFEIEQAGWTAIYTLTANERSTGEARYGSYSARLANDSGAAAYLFTPFTAESVTTTISLWVKLIRGAAVSISLQEYFGQYSVVASSKSTQNQVWERLSASGATTQGSKYRLRLTVPNGAAVYIDGAQAEAKSYPTTYCDGDLGVGYTWSGAPHASPSARTATSVQYAPADVSLPAGALVLWMQPGRFYNWTYVFGGYPPLFDSYLDANGSVWFRVYDDANQNGVSLHYSLGAGEADRWHHVAYVWSQAAIGGDNLWLYVDGELRDRKASAHWPTSLPEKRTRLQPDNGRVVARLAIFARALSAGEIAALYHTSAPAGR